VANADVIPAHARVLDVACGRGRNAVYLARRGCAVHAVDRDVGALQDLQALADADRLPIRTEVQDLEAGTPPLAARGYDTVVVFNYLHRPLMPVLIQALTPAGVLIYETFTIGQARRGHPKNPAFLLHDGELPRLVAPLRVLRSREGDFDGRLVASIVAVAG
jgi:SAM-dependent methyltransferase